MFDVIHFELSTLQKWPSESIWHDYFNVGRYSSHLRLKDGGLDILQHLFKKKNHFLTNSFTLYSTFPLRIFSYILSHVSASYYFKTYFSSKLRTFLRSRKFKNDENVFLKIVLLSLLYIFILPL